MNTRVRIEGNRRELLEQAVARGVPNSRIMADFGVTYGQLRRHVAAMAHEPPARRVRAARGSHGTESGWNTHRRKKETACEPCRAEHETRFAAEKASRDAARAEKRYRGVA